LGAQSQIHSPIEEPLNFRAQYSFLMSLAPLQRPFQQLFNCAKLIKNGTIKLVNEFAISPNFLDFLDFVKIWI